MERSKSNRVVGLLFSGGLDSAILLSDLLRGGCHVQPLYVRAALRWEQTEIGAAREYLAALGSSRVNQLVEIASPLAELYGQHWSLDGEASEESVPGYESPDSQVFLPGRNLMLVAPASLWCQTRGIDQLAIGILGSNPFDDGAPGFFQQLQAVLNQSHSRPIALRQPLRETSKIELMRRNADLPLELTFSCLAPVEGMHCGKCNKCAERQRAFGESGLEDRTPYAGRCDLPRLISS